MGIPFEVLMSATNLRAHVGFAAAFVTGHADTLDDLPDGEIAAAAREIEHLGRLVDALRVRVAGAIDHRSRTSLPPEERLAQQHACPSAGDLLAYATGASRRDIQSRIRLDRRTRTGLTLTGETTPAAFPLAAAALRDGRLGVDAAHTITDALTKITERGVAGPDDVAAAEESLVGMAAGGTGLGVPAPDDRELDDVESGEAPALTHDDVRAVTNLWVDALDQDGVEPDAEYAERHRGLTIGRVRDGLVPVHGRLVPEAAGMLQRLLDAHLASPTRGVAFTVDGSAAGLGETDPATNSSRTGEATAGVAGRAAVSCDAERTTPTTLDPANTASEPAGPVLADPTPVDPAHAGPETPWAGSEVVHEPRTVPQRRHDALVGILTAAATSTTAPTTGGAAPTLIVTTTVDSLDGGTCRTDGIDIPLPARIAHRIACTGAVQKIVFDRAGRIVQIGSPERLFTPAQRRAITARDGGCIIPGCPVPASQCEIHHVTEHAHGGPTHTDNGVLLCWWHHHRLDDNGWTIHMRKGVPHVAAPTWIDPHRTPRPARRHSMGTAPRKRRQATRTAVARARGTAPPAGHPTGREPDPTG